MSKYVENTYSQEILFLLGDKCCACDLTRIPDHTFLPILNRLYSEKSLFHAWAGKATSCFSLVHKYS